MRVLSIPLAGAMTLLAATPLLAGVLDDALGNATAAAVNLGVTLILGAVVGYLLSLLSTRASVAHAKTPEERTLADKLAIEAERRMQAMDREQLDAFLRSWALRHLDKFLAAPKVSVDGMLNEAFEAFERRNPELARRLDIDPQSMAEKLAGEINALVYKVEVETGSGHV